MPTNLWILVLIILCSLAVYHISKADARRAERPPSYDHKRERDTAIWEQARALAECLIRQDDASLPLARLIDLTSHPHQPVFWAYGRELVKDIIMSNPTSYMRPDSIYSHMFVAAQAILLERR